MASAQVSETSVANNSISRYSGHPDDHFKAKWNLIDCCKKPLRKRIRLLTMFASIWINFIFKAVFCVFSPQFNPAMNHFECFLTVKNKLTSPFYASVLVLMINFIISLSMLISWQAHEKPHVHLLINAKVIRKMKCSQSRHPCIWLRSFKAKVNSIWPSAAGYKNT